MGLFGRKKKNELVKELLRKAWSFQEKGDFANAYPLYDEVLKKDPQNYWAWHNQGVMLERAGEHEKALGCYFNAIDTDSEEDKTLAKIGYIGSLFNNEEYETVVHQIRFDLSHTLGKTIDAKQLQDIKNMNGWSLKELGRYDEAIQNYDEVLEVDKQCLGAKHDKGVCLEKLEKYDESLKIYDEILEVMPNDETTQTSKNRILNLPYHKMSEEEVDMNGTMSDDKDSPYYGIPRNHEALSTDKDGNIVGYFDKDMNFIKVSNKEK
jgi:tetratricopeptide (TPR) repeat protein